MMVMVAAAFAPAVNSVNINAVSATSQFDKAQNITCNFARQEAIINEADNDDIVDRMMKECGFMNQ